MLHTHDTTEYSNIELLEMPCAPCPRWCNRLSISTCTAQDHIREGPVAVHAHVCAERRAFAHSLPIRSRPYRCVRCVMSLGISGFERACIRTLASCHVPTPKRTKIRSPQVVETRTPLTAQAPMNELLLSGSLYCSLTY
jgi:hypothetical protein